MATAKQKQAFIKKYAPLAQRESLKSGIPASVYLAQMIQESGWGTSEKFKLYNNPFGHKATDNWEGAKTPFYGDPMEGSYTQYRAYDSVVDAFEAHTKWLTGERYNESLWNMFGNLKQAQTPENYVQAIKNAGYATDPNYVGAVTGIIKDNNLTVFDKIQTKIPDGDWDIDGNFVPDNEELGAKGGGMGDDIGSFFPWVLHGAKSAKENAKTAEKNKKYTQDQLLEQYQESVSGKSDETKLGFMGNIFRFLLILCIGIAMFIAFIKIFPPAGTAAKVAGNTFTGGALSGGNTAKKGKGGSSSD